jgi:hypothetical protein
MSKAYRDRGRLHIECDACSSKGATHAETTRAPDGTETLPTCPWCGAALGVPVETLDPPVTPAEPPPVRAAATEMNRLRGLQQ